MAHAVLKFSQLIHEETFELSRMTPKEAFCWADRRLRRDVDGDGEGEGGLCPFFFFWKSSFTSLPAVVHSLEMKYKIKLVSTSYKTQIHYYPYL